MLTRTFIHIPGLGPRTERSLWDQGCLDWSDFLGETRYEVNQVPYETARLEIETSRANLEGEVHQYFARALGNAEAWRAFPEFRKRAVYLDIETDGGDRGDSVTMVGLYDGKEFRALIKGDDLGEFPDVISHYGMIITFFGAGFDLPMLQKAFPNLRFDQLHIDLCPTLRKVGLHGGLKKIEKHLGIDRSEETDGLNGLDAVKLWRAYQRGSDAALERLVAYNREDVVNLERLAEIAYQRLYYLTVPKEIRDLHRATVL
ncbi:MAG TPA: ribonuclease H-like domain-containing protein [Fimbriimonadaceae bacterium]|nr:ribonuclease H-like domain-containing protein [Fimbriimonadaceae bacterium]